MRIEVKNLNYSYGESKALMKKALSNLSLTIEEGEFFGIIGQTGSGKSTFVQHLNGLIKLTKNNGSIRIGEFDLGDKKCDFKKLRSKLGMIFQYPEYQLFAETVFEDVAFGIKNFMPSIPEEEVAKMVKEGLETVGLNYQAIKDKSPFELSGGQKRRVAIAGVIALKPEVLVLDEPVAGLDPQGKKEFIKLLHTLHKTFVKTIILVSHDMDLVSENCSRVAIFSKGEVLSTGTIKEIFNQDKNLKELGLELPTTAYLTNALKEKGVDLENDLTVDDFVNAIIKKYKGVND